VWSNDLLVRLRKFLQIDNKERSASRIEPGDVVFVRVVQSPLSSEAFEGYPISSEEIDDIVILGEKEKVSPRLNRVFQIDLAARE
jgi:hypothetical protein